MVSATKELEKLAVTLEETLAALGVTLDDSVPTDVELATTRLVPLAAVGGYLYRSYLFLTTDDDLFKASYVLTSAPVWALGFGVAFGALGRFPIIRAGVTVCMLIFAVLELRFMMYGIRDHHPIF